MCGRSSLTYVEGGGNDKLVEICMYHKHSETHEKRREEMWVG